MNYYTYAHVRNDTNVIFYIGKGQRSRLIDKHNRNKHWHHIVKKYGFTAIKLATWKNEEEAFAHECFLISCFKSIGNSLVNMTNGGEGGTYPRSEETKKKISIAKKGIKIPKLLGELNPAKTMESRAKRSVAMQNFYKNGGINPMSGRKRPDLSERNQVSKRSGSRNHKSVAIKVNGVEFPTLTAAARHLNIPVTKLNYWARKDPNMYQTEILQVLL